MSYTRFTPIAKSFRNIMGDGREILVGDMEPHPEGLWVSVAVKVADDKKIAVLEAEIAKLKQDLICWQMY